VERRCIWQRQILWKCRHSMKKLLLLCLLSVAAHAQTCSTSNPCAPVQVNGVVGTTATLLECTGSPTSCSQASLAAYLASPTTPSPWHTLGSFSQKAATVNYSDPQPYGALVNYAAYWASGGAVGPVSAIAVFQMPQAPPMGMVTTGT